MLSPLRLSLLSLTALLAGCFSPVPVSTGELSPEATPAIPAVETGQQEVPNPPLPRPAVAWSTPAAVHALQGRSEAPVLTGLGNSLTLAVWTQSHSTAPYQRLWSAVHDGSSWNAPVQLAASAPGSAVSVWSPKDGTATAAWIQYGGTSTRQLMVANWSGNAWSAPEVLQSLTWQQGSMLQPVARLGADGLSLVAWATRAPAAEDYTLRLASRSRGGAWEASTIVASGFKLGRNASSGAQLDLSVDGAGGLLVTWAMEQPGATELWARRGAATAGSVGPIAWQAPQQVSSEPRVPSGDLGTYGLWGGYHAGRFFTGWLRRTVEGQVLVTRHERPAGGWDLEAEADSIRWSHYAPPAFVASANGDKLVLWREGDDSGSRLVARAFDGARGWGPVTVVAGGLAPPYLGCIDVDADAHDLAMDTAGNALAVWEERTPSGSPGTAGTMRVRASRFTKGGGWSAPVQLDGAQGRVSHPVASLAGPDSGLSVWILEGSGGTSPLQGSLLRPAQ